MQNKQQGQVLVLFALGMVVLMGMTALAIDGGNVFSDRRQAQNAADAAAYAAAVAGTQDPYPGKPSIYPAALLRAAENGYVDTIKDPGGSNPESDVIVYYPPITAPFTGNLSYVEVEVISHVDTFFASIIGFDTMTNQVRSIAYFKPGKDDITFAGQAIVALRPEGNCSSGITVQGNAYLNILGGGIFSNTNHPSCAYKSSNCPTIIMPNGSITTVGGTSLGCEQPEIDYIQGATQYQYPPPYDPPNHTCTPASSPTKNEDGTWSVYPGSYNNFPPNIPGIATIVLESGTYCINGNFNINSGDTYLTKGWDEDFKYPNTNVTEGVFFYVDEDAGGFTWNGSAGIHLDALPLRDKSGNIISKDGEPLSQPLIYVDPGSWPYDNNPPVCFINGNSGLTLQGQVYAPYCDLTLNGGAATPTDGLINSQLIGFTVNITGNSYLNILYNVDAPTKYYEAPVIQQVK